MKIYFTSALLAVALLLQVASNAQTYSKAKYGVYLSADDFMHNKLSYAFETENHKNKLILHNIFGSSRIEIVNNDNKKSLEKKDIYGYRDNGVDHRLMNNEDFLIVDTSDFLMYGQTHETRLMKWQVQKQTSYYFSLTANSKIEPLTKSNIENALSYNKEFDHYLNTTFKSDGDLAEYNKRVKKYEIKYLYEEYEKR
ncbi:MAG: hypothetical protein M3R72_04095 [Bacteroidota bacterium]|nr:hypothetical protein [Bacteroidota bacterium]